MHSLRFAIFAWLLSLIPVPTRAQPFFIAAGKITKAAFGRDSVHRCSRVVADQQQGLPTEHSDAAIRS